MKEEAFLKAARSHILKKYGQYKLAAEAWKLKPPYLCLILKGERPPNGLMLKELGYKRIAKTNIEYVKRDKE